ncbi:MAG TPA: hypothetical protein DEQ42_20130 [Shigella sp.]|nr:hypothetical protein [Shigella sp.]
MFLAQEVLFATYPLYDNRCLATGKTSFTAINLSYAGLTFSLPPEAVTQNSCPERIRQIPLDA